MNLKAPTLGANDAIILQSPPPPPPLSHRSPPGCIKGSPKASILEANDVAVLPPPPPRRVCYGLHTSSDDGGIDGCASCSSILSRTQWTVPPPPPPPLAFALHQGKSISTTYEQVWALFRTPPLLPDCLSCKQQPQCGKEITLPPLQGHFLSPTQRPVSCGPSLAIKVNSFYKIFVQDSTYTRFSSLDFIKVHLH